MQREAISGTRKPDSRYSDYILSRQIVIKVFEEKDYGHFW
jgi:hypothetical protein